jgi:sec-independent protein translocase protein TatC
MAEQDEGKMSFLDHLGELRKRIVWGLVATTIGFLITFSFSERIVGFLARPLPGKLAQLAPTEVFWVHMKVAMIAGLFLALPVVLYQVWAFVAPGLLPHERRYAAPFVIIGSVMFAAGVAFALWVVVPFAIKFLLAYKTGGVIQVISIGSYVDFVLKFSLAFGLVFELPLAITVGSRMGIVTPQFLAKNRKYAILINFIVAAILTPTPDILNQTLMAGPLIILYEVGIISARIFGKKPKPAPQPVEA